MQEKVEEVKMKSKERKINLFGHDFSAGISKQ